MFSSILFNFMKNKQIDTEVEIRFHNRGMFNKGVPLDVFERIKNNLDEDSDFFVDNKNGHKTTTLQGNSTTRLIVDNVTQSQIAQQKQKLKQFDVRDYNFRLAEAKETNIEVNTTNLFDMYKNPSSIREKHRFTYQHSSKLWKIDITKVMQNQQRVYEIELEFLNIKGNLKEIVELIQTRNVPEFTKESKQNLLEAVYVLLGRTPEFISLELDLNLGKDALRLIDTSSIADICKSKIVIYGAYMFIC